MQHDEVIWQIINQQFCSFKSKIARERTFCQNPYNVTGLCLRSACPLANSSYATIREEEGVCFLFIKTIERAHSPKNLWEKIKLPANYAKSLEIVSQHLEHFPKYLVHRNKQRLTKIHQMLIRMRRLQLKSRAKIVTTNTKVEQREKGRERKALKAAQLDKAIEKELLERLKQVTDNEIYNYPEQQYNKALNRASKKFEKEGEELLEDPDVEDEEHEDEEEEDGEFEYEDEEQEAAELEQEEEVDGEEEEGNEYNVEYIEDFEESDEEMEDMGSSGSRFSAPSASFYSKSSQLSGKRRIETDNDDNEDDSRGNNSRGNNSKKARREDRSKGKRNKRGTRVEIEYEEERESQQAQRVAQDTEGMDFNF